MGILTQLLLGFGMGIVGGIAIGILLFNFKWFRKMVT